MCVCDFDLWTPSSSLRRCRPSAYLDISMGCVDEALSWRDLKAELLGDEGHVSLSSVSFRPPSSHSLLLLLFSRFRFSSCLASFLSFFYSIFISSFPLSLSHFSLSVFSSFSHLIISLPLPPLLLFPFYVPPLPSIPLFVCPSIYHLSIYPSLLITISSVYLPYNMHAQSHT